MRRMNASSRSPSGAPPKSFRMFSARVRFFSSLILLMWRKPIGSPSVSPTVPACHSSRLLILPLRLDPGM